MPCISRGYMFHCTGTVAEKIQQNPHRRTLPWLPGMGPSCVSPGQVGQLLKRGKVLYMLEAKDPGLSTGAKIIQQPYDEQSVPPNILGMFWQIHFL